MLPIHQFTHTVAMPRHFWVQCRAQGHNEVIGQPTCTSIWPKGGCSTDRSFTLSLWYVWRAATEQTNSVSSRAPSARLIGVQTIQTGQILEKLQLSTRAQPFLTSYLFKLHHAELLLLNPNRLLLVGLVDLGHLVILRPLLSTHFTARTRWFV